MVTCLSTLTRLESLRLSFESPQPRPEWERRHTSLSTRALLPSLTCLMFKGAGKYFEDIVDRIDAPLLQRLSVKFYNQPIFNTPRLAQFISRAPKFKTCNEIRICLDCLVDSVKALSLPKTTTNASLLLERGFTLPVRQSRLVQIASSLPQALTSTVERLIFIGDISLNHDYGSDPNLWRELLRPFTAVKDLYLDLENALHIARALQELVGDNALELFPVLQNIFLEELQPSRTSRPFPEGIEQFVAARQATGSHPISVSRWKIDKEVECF